MTHSPTPNANPNDVDDNGIFVHLPDASPDDLAMMSLIGVRDALRAAQWPAWVAAFSLTGACQARGKELISLISEAHAFCERLKVVVEGDARTSNPDRLS
jgi:hypothetical protein